VGQIPLQIRGESGSIFSATQQRTDKEVDIEELQAYVESQTGFKIQIAAD
jgi:hypothetical protein